MRRQIYVRACIPIPTLGATAALAKLCALLVAARALALAKLCARVTATALELLAASTSRGRFSSCVPHVTVESGCEGLGRQGLFSPTKSALLPSKKFKPRFYFSYRFYFIKEKENYMFPMYILNFKITRPTYYLTLCLSIPSTYSYTIMCYLYYTYNERFSRISYFFAK